MIGLITKILKMPDLPPEIKDLRKTWTVVSSFIFKLFKSIAVRAKVSVSSGPGPLATPEEGAMLSCGKFCWNFPAKYENPDLFVTFNSETTN